MAAIARPSSTRGLPRRPTGAPRLFTAVHTVEVHLVHVYAKLGIRSRSRSQLASQLAWLPARGAGD